MDNGREFCGRPDRHPYELFMQRNFVLPNSICYALEATRRLTSLAVFVILITVIGGTVFLFIGNTHEIIKVLIGASILGGTLSITQQFNAIFNKCLGRIYLSKIKNVISLSPDISSSSTSAIEAEGFISRDNHLDYIFFDFKNMNIYYDLSYDITSNFVYSLAMQDISHIKVQTNKGNTEYRFYKKSQDDSGFIYAINSSKLIYNNKNALEENINKLNEVKGKK